MKYIYVPLTSARSHPEQNSKSTTLDELKRYAKLDAGTAGSYYISFTVLPKIGINPKNVYGTPIGVYAYPLALVRNKNGSYKIPFAKDRPYIQVLKLTTNRVLDSANFTQADYDACVSKLKKLADKNKAAVTKNIEKISPAFKIVNFDWQVTGEDDVSSSNGSCWCSVETLSEEMANRLSVVTGQHGDTAKLLFFVWACSRVLAACLATTAKSQATTVKWNAILRKVLGYDVILDRGLGFIHPNEPIQAVFLCSSAYEHVDTISNKTLDARQKTYGKLARQIFSSDKQVKGNVVLSKMPSITRLPDGLTIDGNLDLRKSKLVALPKGLTVTGRINFDRTYYTEIPENWTIKGGCSLFRSQITKIGDNFYVGEDLNLMLTKIKSLPRGMVVKGDLYLDNSAVESLPNDLVVGGDLSLSSSRVANIPDGVSIGGGLLAQYSRLKTLPVSSEMLHINGDLDLTGSDIVSLPNGLTVHGTLTIQQCYGLLSLPENLTVGKLKLQDSALTELPKNLTVHDDLRLDRPYIKVGKLSDNLHVDGDLNLATTAIATLPQGLVVGGSLDIRGTDIDTIPDDAQVGGDIVVFPSAVSTLKIPDRLRSKVTGKK